MNTILLADPQPVTRNGLRWVLASSRFSNAAVFEADGLDAALEKIRQEGIEVLIADVSPPVAAGVDGLARIRAAFPALRMVVHTALDQEPLIRHLLRIGVNGFVAKNSEAFRLVECLVAVAAGELYIASQHAVVMQDPRAGEVPKKNAYLGLTPRQHQLVSLLAAGNKSSEIAAKLGISIRSVETYRSKLLQKLKVRNTGELISWGIKTGVVKV